MSILFHHICQSWKNIILSFQDMSKEMQMNEVICMVKWWLLKQDQYDETQIIQDGLHNNIESFPSTLIQIFVQVILITGGYATTTTRDLATVEV